MGTARSPGSVIISNREKNKTFYGEIHNTLYLKGDFTMNDQEIKTMETEEITALANDEASNCDECETDSVLGTLLKAGLVLGAGMLACVVVRHAQPKLQELKEKRAKQKAAKNAVKSAVTDDSDDKEIEEA